MFKFSWIRLSKIIGKVVISLIILSYFCKLNTEATIWPLIEDRGVFNQPIINPESNKIINSYDNILSTKHTNNNDPHQQSSDAPKYYQLNALLYKQSIEAAANGKQHPKMGDLRPLDGSPRINPEDRMIMRSGEGDDEESSIDSLIRAMRGRSNKEGSAIGAGLGGVNLAAAEEDDRMGGAAEADGGGGGTIRTTRINSGKTNNVAGSNKPDDGATIQRKFTSNEDADLDFASGGGPSRLTRAEPRRKRRASAKQAPPKLKYRRISRNSRRRKLRHGIKPKRRA